MDVHRYLFGMRGTWMLMGVVSAALVGCVGDLGSDDGVDDTDDPMSSGASGGNDGGTTNGVGGDDTTTTGANPTGGQGGGGNQDPVAEVCDRWNADRAFTGEGAWSGNVSSCSAGDVSADGRANALRQLNLYRWLAGLPEVTTDPQRDARAQDCALMMHANGALSHNPPSSWDCYTSDGDQSAGTSNIASGPGVMAVDMYMSDFGAGNAPSMGHRRWILSNSLGPVGLGSTSSASCMTVIGGNGNANATWTAFPSPGVFPIEALTASFESVDATGWTIQSDDIDLDDADVVVTDDGTPVPVTVASLLGGFGSSSAIKLTPDGWQSQPEHTYRVSVTGVSQPFDYEVTMVACE